MTDYFILILEAPIKARYDELSYINPLSTNHNTSCLIYRLLIWLEASSTNTVDIDTGI